MSQANLIERITPLYNFYKTRKANLSGTEALMVMWEIGNYLKKFIEKNKVKPHTLYREIYGKSEGTKNITQKSYITREFQGRCYRIRNIFSSKKQIRTELPSLKSFTAFRESMPFLDNPKYKLVGKEKEKLLSLLNSNLGPRYLLKKIRALQDQKINRKNPRTQRLNEVEDIKQIFIQFYNKIYSLLREKDYSKIKEFIDDIGMEHIKALARNTDSLSQEGLKSFDFEIPEDIDELWKEYTIKLKYLTNQINAKARRRFRRVVKPERVVRLADMLNALTSKNLYNNFKQ